MKAVTVHALTMGELQQGKLEVKPVDLRLECSDIHGAAQHILLDADFFLSNAVLFVAMLTIRWKLRYSCETSEDNATGNLRHLVF